MNKQVPKNVLFAFFEGRTTTLEGKLIEEWLSETGNEEWFYRYLDEWESQHPQFRPDSEKALEHWESVVSYPDWPTESMEPRRKKSRFWWPVAASIALLLGVATLLFQKQIRHQSYHTAYGETKSVRLTEGTLVTLNSNSTLWVPRWGFNTGTRQVLLEGEAEFKVTHTNDNLHFLVKTDADFEVEALGTEFVVHARQRDNHVLLNQGKVQVNYQSGRKMYLRPGDLLRLGDGAAPPLVTHVKQSLHYTAWKHHQFYFDDTPLSEVALLIHEQFGVKVIIDDPLTANRRIAGIFQAKDAEQLLAAITALLDLKMVKHENSVSLHASNPK